VSSVISATEAFSCSLFGANEWDHILDAPGAITERQLYLYRQ